MMFRNSFKLLLSNFTIVWKIFAYYAACFLIILGLASLFAIPVLNVLKANNFFLLAKEELANIFMKWDIYGIVNTFSNITSDFITIMNNNMEAVRNSLIGVFLILVVFGSFIFSLSQIAINDNLNGYMSSNANFGFMNSYVRNFSKSLKLGLVRLFINLPINLLVAYIAYNLLPLLTSANEFVLLVAPFTIITLSIGLMSLNLTVFSGVIPAIVVHDYGVLKGYKAGFKAVGRRFFKTWSNAIFIVLIVAVINMFAITLTGGAAFLITLPSTIILFAIFAMVVYYGSMGMRYYVDNETILTPKRLEEQDSIKTAKFII